MTITMDTQTWAEEQFAQCDLGDQRRTRRLVYLANQVLCNPSGTLPDQTENWGDLKAAYRLFDCEEVTFDAIARPHWEQTRRRPPGTYLQAVWKAQQRLQAILDQWQRSPSPQPSPSGRGQGEGLCPVPDEPLPLMSGTFNVPLYGMNRWGDLFTARQKVALATLVRLLTAESQRTQRTDEMSEAVRAAMAVVIGRMADYGSSVVSWAQSGEFVRSTFGRQAIPIVWDFAEAVPWTGSSGNLDGAVDWVAKVVEAWASRDGNDSHPSRDRKGAAEEPTPTIGPLPSGRGAEGVLFGRGSVTAHVQQADATEHPLPDETAQVWFTDVCPHQAQPQGKTKPS